MNISSIMKHGEHIKSVKVKEKPDGTKKMKVKFEGGVKGEAIKRMKKETGERFEKNSFARRYAKHNEARAFMRGD